MQPTWAEAKARPAATPATKTRNRRIRRAGAPRIGTARPSSSRAAVDCVACHGADYRGGGSGVSCFRCHDGPGGHASGWADAVQHGAAAGGAAVAGCALCHGGDFHGGWSGVSCYTCHPGPTGRHAGDYADPGQHGAEVIAAAGPAACTSCHGLDYGGGRSGVSCSDCHDGIGGHPVNWDAPSRHGSAVEAGGAAACAACHGADFLGGWAATSCYECHDGPGGHPLGWSHYTRHGRTASLYGPAACGACHGADYRGGWSGISCYQCHVGPYAVHPLGWAEPGAHGDGGRRQTAPTAAPNATAPTCEAAAAAFRAGSCHEGPNP